MRTEGWKEMKISWFILRTFSGTPVRDSISFLPFENKTHQALHTDTRLYWELSENIYRYNHDDFDKRDGLGGIHTINESLSSPSPASQ